MSWKLYGILHMAIPLLSLSTSFTTSLHSILLIAARVVTSRRLENISLRIFIMLGISLVEYDPLPINTQIQELIELR